jgi:hypothetical protein
MYVCMHVCKMSNLQTRMLNNPLSKLYLKSLLTHLKQLFDTRDLWRDIFNIFNPRDAELSHRNGREITLPINTNGYYLTISVSINVYMCIYLYLYTHALGVYMSFPQMYIL